MKIIHDGNLRKNEHSCQIFWSTPDDHKLPGETAVLTCFDAEYMCLTNGIFFINHSPTQKTVEPTHDDTNIPTINMNTRDVTNPRPGIKKNCSTQYRANHEYLSVELSNDSLFLIA